MDQPRVISHKGTRILCIAELRGELTLLNKLAKIHNADVIIHTGNFGFFDNGSVSSIHETYLRHIVAFSPILDESLLTNINQLSRANGEYVDHDADTLRNYLQDVKLSQLMDFINGDEVLEIPVYTVYGMVEDSNVLNKFKTGKYFIKNLFILDELSTYTINVNDQVELFLCGIGGSLSFQKLFHQGNQFDDYLKRFHDDVNDENVNINDTFDHDDHILPVSGEPGNIWLTLLTIGQFIKTVETQAKDSDVRIMITHPSPSREGLLAHLSVLLKIDYTISNGLHFLYPSSFNELSVCPNFEFYKLKFSDSRNQLSSIWINVQKEVENLIQNDEFAKDLLSIALNSFDRIPVLNSISTNNHTSDQEIIPLSLSFNKRDVNSNTIRLQSDAYYLSFQNQWHFNLCDVSIGEVILNVDNGLIKFEASSEGFDFKFKRDGSEIRERRNNGYNKSRGGGGHSNNVSGFRGGRGRGRGRYKQ